jgi:heme exporter protein A
MEKIPGFSIQAQALSKHFGEAPPLFSPISFTMNNGMILGITGWNGSGKSTLIRMLAGLLRPGSGSVEFIYNNLQIAPQDYGRHIGLVAPYLSLYEEFTPNEHARIYCRLLHIEYPAAYVRELLHILGLSKRGNDSIRTFSSGMKQRVKYLLALLHRPALLLLDEPGANIDEQGMNAILTLLKLHIEQSGGIIIATNEQRESALCDTLIQLSPL